MQIWRKTLAMEKLPMGDRRLRHPAGNDPPRRPRGQPAPPAICRRRTTKKRKVCLCLKDGNIAGERARTEANGGHCQGEAQDGEGSGEEEMRPGDLQGAAGRGGRGWRRRRGDQRAGMSEEKWREEGKFLDSSYV